MLTIVYLLSFIKLLGISDSDEEDTLKKEQANTVTVIRLRPGHDGGDGTPPKSWFEKRKERIFRKKTLNMRFPLLKWLPKYSGQDFVSDLVAGITVGVTVIPQALAYANVAGLPPQVSMYNILFFSFYKLH